MNPGDLFDPSGYEVVAVARYAESLGEVLVMHNNSTHILLAIRPYDGELAQLERSWSYAEPGAMPFKERYRYALSQMIGLAVSR